MIELNLYKNWTILILTIKLIIICIVYTRVQQMVNYYHT